MKYDFTSILDRDGKDAIAVNPPQGSGVIDLSEIKEGFDVIPMWIADMNFPTVPTIPKMLIDRAKHPAYGYFVPREEYFSEIIKWHQVRNQVTGLTKKCIGYQNSILGGVVSALNVLCSKGDNVLFHSPTYVGFTYSLMQNGYNMVLSPLVKDEDNIWRMDYEDMETKIQQNHIHVAVLCSPHNPTGRVWERWELEKAMEIFARNDVYVISDEIWSDLILSGYQHFPTQSISDDAKNRTIALYAPSKTFNMAGLIGAYHIIYNPWLRDRMKKESLLSHYNEMNVLSMYALIGAYQAEGYEWVDELCQVLTENVEYAYDFFHNKVKGIDVSKPQGTYMLLLDCGEWCRVHDKSIVELKRSGEKVGVLWQDGRPFHCKYGIRMNLALPFSRVKEALSRLEKYVFVEG